MHKDLQAGLCKHRDDVDLQGKPCDAMFCNKFNELCGIPAEETCPEAEREEKTAW